MKRSKILVLAAVALMWCVQSMAQTLTLKESVETAIANNLDVKRSEFAAQQAAIDKKQAWGNLLPDLNANINHSSNQGRSIDPFTNSYINQSYSSANYNLSSNIVLFNGFRLMNIIKQTSLALAASEMEVQQAKDNLTLNVILAYLAVLTNNDLLTTSRNNLELSLRQVERLEEMNKVGAIRPSDLADLKGQLASNQLALINAQNNLNQSKLTLAQFMNVPYNKDLQLEPVNVAQLDLGYTGDVEAIYQAAMEQLGIVKAANFRKESATKGIHAARGALYPTLFLSGGIGTNYSSVATRETILSTVDAPTNAYVVVGGNNVPVLAPKSTTRSDKISYGDQFKNNYGTSIGIGLQIPILNSLSVRNRLSLAKIQEKNAEVVAKSTQIQLKQLVEQAWFTMTAAQERYKTTLEQVAAFTESFQAAEARFNAGVGTSIDYLTVKNSLDQANINLVVARYDYLLRTKVLDYYQGKPLW